MNSITPSTSTRTLSKDGRTWHDDSPFPWPAKPDNGVSKIVIGSLDKIGRIDEDQSLLDGLAEISTHYPKLPHLHLWGVTNLERLGGRSEGLQCLDVRKCGRLTSVESIPASLETLDLGECSSLKDLPPMPAIDLT